MADGMPVLLAVILSLLIGVFVGVVNAFFIDKLKMPSLIMTLGTNTALFRKYSNQQFVKTFENPTYFSFAFKKVLGVTPSKYVKMIKE